MVELLLTVVFLTLGTQMVQAGFLKAAEVFGRYDHTIRAMNFAQEEEAAAREEILVAQWEDRSGVLPTSGKALSWSRSVSMKPERDLYSVRTRLHWDESGRPYEMIRERFIFHRDMSLGE